jgi:GeoRSP system PqqD family protein
MVEKPKLKRNPDAVWREEPSGIKAALESGDPDVPCLTLVHLGTLHQLNHAAAEIWKLCDGTRDETLIAEALAGCLDAPREILDRDVNTFLRDMLSRGWLVEA